MCWSATADLVAGTVITAVGAVCVARVRRVRDLPLAALPLLLGVHQLLEAVVWRDGGGSGPAVTAWAVIALPLLPVWVPLAVLWASPAGVRRRLWVPVAVGLVTGAVLAVRLARAPVVAEVRGHRMGYTVDLPYAPLLLAGYLVAVLGVLWASGDRLLVRLGAVTGVGAAVCGALWRWEFVSTWCALAAVASVLLLPWPRRAVPAVGVGVPAG
ncbi:DUF6629 family protein [Streptomyces sp. NPDC097619]|uniref:DUF6629 family protein n=1 Tax=Streptomyces sp. NPDC097619 TaxID=3157228 RepID=UPI003327F953